MAESRVTLFHNVGDPYDGHAPVESAAPKKESMACCKEDYFCEVPWAAALLADTKSIRYGTNKVETFVRGGQRPSRWMPHSHLTNAWPLSLWQSSVGFMSPSRQDHLRFISCCVGICPQTNYRKFRETAQHRPVNASAEIPRLVGSVQGAGKQAQERAQQPGRALAAAGCVFDVRPTAGRRRPSPAHRP